MFRILMYIVSLLSIAAPAGAADRLELIADLPGDYTYAQYMNDRLLLIVNASVRDSNLILISDGTAAGLAAV